MYFIGQLPQLGLRLFVTQGVSLRSAFGRFDRKKTERSDMGALWDKPCGHLTARKHTSRD
jgi:hypothetical protein